MDINAAADVSGVRERPKAVSVAARTLSETITSRSWTLQAFHTTQDAHSEPSHRANASDRGAATCRRRHVPGDGLTHDPHRIRR